MLPSGPAPAGSCAVACIVELVGDLVDHLAHLEGRVGPDRPGRQPLDDEVEVEVRHTGRGGRRRAPDHDGRSCWLICSGRNRGRRCNGGGHGSSGGVGRGWRTSAARRCLIKPPAWASCPACGVPAHGFSSSPRDVSTGAHAGTSAAASSLVMQAVTVVPGTAGSARFESVAEPDPGLGSVVVEALAVGICGTDAEIAAGDYGWAPPGEERLILGHESLGRVVDPGPPDLAVGDHVVGIVRRPDPVPCPNCAVGEWDMCSNGRYTERGIKEVHGFMSERWRIEPEYVVRVDPALGILGVLLEPTTVVAKAWEQILTIGQRTFWDPRTVLVVGAGPIGSAGRADRRAARPRRPRARPGDRPVPSRRSSPISAPPTTAVRSTTSVCARTSSSSAPASARSSSRSPTPSRRAASSASPASARRRRPRRSRCRRWPPTPCSTTSCCSARSTPTAATTTAPRRRWRAPTGRGSNG